MTVFRERYRHVDRVGIELEGGWCVGCIPFSGGELHEDGSVEVSCPDEHEACGDWWGGGEYPSPPLYPRDIERWIEEHYPHRVNATCGLHVHVSLQNRGKYAACIDAGFHEFLKTRVTEWATAERLGAHHRLWPRLRGDNTYCQNRFDPFRQIHQRGKGSDRYMHLNYCWGLHGTIECRLLPAFDSESRALKAIATVVNAFEDWVQTHLPRPFRTHDDIREEEVPVPPVADTLALDTAVVVDRLNARRFDRVVELAPHTIDLHTDVDALPGTPTAWRLLTMQERPSRLRRGG